MFTGNDRTNFAPNNNFLEMFVGIDDANLIFDNSFERRPDLGLPVIHHLLSTVRKGGIVIHVCTQTPHQVGASIHSNAFMKVIFNLSNGKDIISMLTSMGIYDEDQMDYAYRLKEREVIIKFTRRWPDPFLAKVPELNIPDDYISDDEIHKNNERIMKTFPPVILVKREDEEKNEEVINEKEKAVLFDIISRPYICSKTRRESLTL